MKKYALIALTLTCVFAFATGLRADDGIIVAHVDQEFVVAGKTFSPGTYRFAPEFPGSGYVTMRNIEGDSAAMLLPMIFEHAASKHSHLILQRVDGVSYLSQVATPRGVYTLTSREALNKLAKSKEQDRLAQSGTN